MHLQGNRTSLWAGLAALLSVTPLSAQGLPPTPPDHVVIVIMENHAASEIIGSSAAPYINSLANAGANMGQSFAITHPSEPNYLALFSGSTQGLSSDACPLTYSTDNLAQQLINAGRTFVGYSESLPSVGYTGCTSGAYARKHAPWVNFPSLPTTLNQPFSAFPADFTQLPTISIVVPNLNDDMHDGTIQQGDTWIKNNLDAYAQWALAHNSLLIVTFDEDDSSSANQIATVFYGPMVKTGVYNEHINHYSMLRTLEDLYGLPYAANAATANTILDIWKGGSANTVTATITAPSSNLTVASGTSVSFAGSATDSSSTATLSYAWTFGDGGTAAGTSASHTFTNGGASPVNYTVTFKATDDTGAVGTATRTITVNGTTSGTQNEVESNNSRSTANAVATSGTTVVGYISSSSDTDYFKVTVASGHTLSATLTPPSASDFDLYLYNSAGTQVASSVKGTGLVDSASVTNSGASATYYVRVKYYAGASTVNPYTLKLTF